MAMIDNADSLIDHIKIFIKHHKLIPEGSTIIVGLSGGPDSVFLLHVLHKLSDEYGYRLIAAHLDHQWRKDSDKDVQFCINVAEQLKVPLVIGKAQDIILHKKTSSKEEEGRLLRRAFFERVLHDNNANLIALAHHQQDQQENFFIRLIRGTTLSGLVGMQPKTGVYIRPLLEIKKAAIIDYLEHNKIAYLIDPTNIQETFLRNCIRLKVIPTLQECDKRFDANFERTLKSLQKTEDFLEKITADVLNELSFKKNESIVLDYEKLSLLDDYLQNRILVMWLIQANVPFELSEALLEEVKRFFKNKKSKQHTLYQSWLISKEKNYARINVMH